MTTKMGESVLNKFIENLAEAIEDEEYVKEFCEKNMSTHTDWTGTRVETKEK